MRCRNLKPQLEFLESRDCPAPLTFVFNGAGILQITGHVDNANGGLQVVATGPNQFNVIDGVTPALTGAFVPGNISITTDSSDDSILIDLTNGSMNGGLRVDTSTGNDSLLI